MAGSLLRRLAIAALWPVPRRAVSRLAGRIAEIEWPRPVQHRLNQAFGRVVGVCFEEMRDPVETHRSLQAFFTRSLAEGARPIDPAPDSIVSPCDGHFGEVGRVEDGRLLQIKGRPYSVAALLGDADRARSFEGGAYLTIYLSPRDYHRFHMPCSGRVVRASHLPGTLWPVNRAGVEGIDALFAQNERICAYLEVDGAPGHRLCLVAVGATNVGQVRVVFDDLRTNRRGARRCDRDYPSGGHPFEKGQEWGRFEFGSTLVLIATPGLVALDALHPGEPTRLGRRIGTLHARASDQQQSKPPSS